MTEEQIPQEKEKELTPMGILIDFAKTKIYNTDGPTLIINKAIQLLAKERQAIEEAHMAGDIYAQPFDAMIYFTTRYKQ